MCRYFAETWPELPTERSGPPSIAIRVPRERPIMVNAFTWLAQCHHNKNG
jgi:hypothetical protein